MVSKVPYSAHICTVGKNSTDYCQLDADSLHHVTSLSLILAVTAAAAPMLMLIKYNNDKVEWLAAYVA